MLVISFISCYELAFCVVVLPGFKASHFDSCLICSGFFALFYKISFALEFLREFLCVVTLEVREVKLVVA